jgi:hypothetical protein
MRGPGAQNRRPNGAAYSGVGINEHDFDQDDEGLDAREMVASVACDWLV